MKMLPIIHKELSIDFNKFDEMKVLWNEKRP